MNIEDIVQDDEIGSLLPALTEDKLNKLGEAIKTAGRIHDPLIYSEETKHLLDGRHRLKLYREFLRTGVPIEPPRLEGVSLPNRLAEMEFVVDRQRNKRNLTDKELAVIRGMLYKETKRTPETQAVEKPRDGKGVFSSTNSQSAQSEQSGSQHTPTAEEIGKKHGGVSAPTVRRDEKRAEALARIREVNSKAADNIADGSLKVSWEDVIALAASGDIGKGIRNLRLHGDWQGQNGKPAPKPAEEKPDPPPKSGVDPAIYKRVIALEKSYNALGGHVSWLKAHATQAASKNALNEIDEHLKPIFRNIQKLKKQVS